jgi:general secretion pathway protein G
LKNNYLLFVALTIFIGFLIFPKLTRCENVLDAVAKKFDERSARHAIEVTKADITDIVSLALDLYELDNGSYPATEQGLDALIERPTIEPIPSVWKGPYCKKLPKDYWENPYHYMCPGIHNKETYDLFSYGPDGVESNDDITNWSNPK